LFVDWVKKAEDLDSVALMQTRRIVRSKLSAAVYRPKTEAELKTRYGDHAYAQLVINDAIARGRSQPDPLDRKLMRYWVLDDERLEFANTQEMSMALEMQLEMGHDDAFSLTADGATFGAVSNLQMGPIAGSEVARLDDANWTGSASECNAPAGKKAHCMYPLWKAVDHFLASIVCTVQASGEQAEARAESCRTHTHTSHRNEGRGRQEKTDEGAGDARRQRDRRCFHCKASTV
jgi:hypothetical protein